MHVISRQVNEGLVIGDDVFVTVLEIQDDFVRLGISNSASSSEYEEHVIYLDSAELEEELLPR